MNAVTIDKKKYVILTKKEYETDQELKEDYAMILAIDEAKNAGRASEEEKKIFLKHLEELK